MQCKKSFETKRITLQCTVLSQGQVLSSSTSKWKIVLAYCINLLKHTKQYLRQCACALALPY